MEGSGTKLFSWYVNSDLTTPYTVYRCSSLYQVEVYTINMVIGCILMCMLSLYRLKSAKVTDKRVRVMNEIISGMRLIKMYAWEWAFHEYVKKIRKSASKNSLIKKIFMFVVCQEGEQDHKSS